MYHLRNKEGSAHRYPESKAKRDELLKCGYIDVDDEEAAKKAANAAAKAGDGK